MRDERPSLLSPDPADLPLLFEAGRLLVRHASLDEAMSPLLTFLADRADLAGGIAALAFSDEGEVRVAAVADPTDAALAGKRIELGGGILGKALASATPAFESEGLAVPVILGGTAVGALSFSRYAGEKDHALSIASSVAALVAEALGLRRRLARAAALGDTGAGHVVPQATEPLAVDEGWAPAAIIGRAAPMRELYSLMDRVAGTETTVLISGESGTGKELVARALHERSGRAKAAFIAVNCAALPESGHRERALRPRAWLFHGGAGTEARPLRARRRRHSFPRRSRRALAGRPSQAPARSARGRVSASRRVRHPQDRCPRNRGHQSRPRERGGRDTLPLRPVLAAQRLSFTRPSPQGAPERHCSPRGLFRREARSQIGQAHTPHLQPGHRPVDDLSLAGQRARARELHRAGGNPFDGLGHSRLPPAAEPAIRRFHGHGSGIDARCVSRAAGARAPRRSS